MSRHRSLWPLIGAIAATLALLHPWFLPLLVIPIAILFRSSRSYRLTRYRHIRGLCEACGYDLMGNVSGVCPECGTEIKKP